MDFNSSKARLQFYVQTVWFYISSWGVTKTKTLENLDLRPKTRISFWDYEN